MNLSVSLYLLIFFISGSKSAWFVDFYAPWCPPCMRLLPELRKASREFEDSVNFGTIDCTIHSSLCQRYNIHAYPTTMFFNQSESELFRGSHTASEIVEFIQDMLNPSGLYLPCVYICSCSPNSQILEMFL